MAIEDILLYLMDISLRGDDVEAAVAIRQTLEKRKVPVKELQRSLVKNDVARSGYIDHKSFEKIYLKLCGGTTYVKSDYMTDIERYIDPKKDGKLDINFLLGICSLSSDVVRAESKLKNLFKIMRVKGINYRELINKDFGKFFIYLFCVILCHFIVHCMTSP